MDRFIIITILVLTMGANAEVTREGCRLPSLLSGPLTTPTIPQAEVGEVHQVNPNNSICFSGVSTDTSSYVPSCCSNEMEKEFLGEAETLIRSDIVRNLGKAQEILANHTSEFDQFMIDSVEYVRQWTIVKLNTTYYVNGGMVDEINRLFWDMIKYVRSESGKSRAEIARGFLDDLYSELITQKTRRKTKKYVRCSLRVMGHLNPYFVKLHHDYIESVLAQPLIDAKAYLRGLGEVQGVFSRLRGLSMSDACRTNILKLTRCSYCQGHGLRATPCPEFCPRLYMGCTILHRGGFFRRWEAFVDVMRLIGENMIQVPFAFMKLSIAMGKAVQDFNFLWRRSQYHVQSVCGRHRRPERFGFIGGHSDPTYADRDYYSYAVSVAEDDVVGNLTEIFTNPETFCGTPQAASDTTIPCWNGTDMSLGDTDLDSILLASDTPPEVWAEARALRRLTLKLRQATLHGVDDFKKLEEENGDRRPARRKDEERTDDGTTTIAYQDGICPNRWAQYNTSCYFMTPRLPFTEARAECAARGGDVASILSSEENAFVAQLMVNKRAWIGATRGDEGDFNWLDGTDYVFNQTDLAVNDNSHACAEMVLTRWGRGVWRSSPCDDRNIAVCKTGL